MKRYVWVISDEKYGAQAVFKTKRAAVHALERDEGSVLAPSGYSPTLDRFLVRTPK